MGDGPSESQAGDDPATFDDDGVGYGNINTTTEQALADDPSINPNITVQDVQNFRSANTPSFTQQSQNYVDDFSGANIGSLPTSRSTSTASLPSTFGKDYTRDYSDFTTADQLTSMSNSINNPLSNFLTRLGLPTTQNRINQGYTPSYTGPKDNQQITGTMDYGIGMGMPSNDKDMTGRGLAVSNYSPFDATQPQVDFGDIGNAGGDGSDSPQIIRRNPSDPMQGDPTDPTDPILSDELASDYLQNPYYLYSGIGNQYQPYGYAQNTLVDLLRTRNMTQPQQRAANLGLFGNPGDFS